MIIKSYEIDKISSSKNKLILIYGPNRGFKDQIIKNKFESTFVGEISNRYYKENTS